MRETYLYDCKNNWGRFVEKGLDKLLSEKEKRIVELKMSGLTFVQVGLKIGLSRARVFQLFYRAFRKMDVDQKSIYYFYN